MTNENTGPSDMEKEQGVADINTIKNGEPFAQSMCDEQHLSTMANELTGLGKKVVNIYELGMRKYPGPTPDKDIIANFFLVMAVTPPPQQSDITVPRGVVMPGPGGGVN